MQILSLDQTPEFHLQQAIANAQKTLPSAHHDKVVWKNTRNDGKGRPLFSFNYQPKNTYSIGQVFVGQFSGQSEHGEAYTCEVMAVITE